jgi:hypothetical protein
MPDFMELIRQRIMLVKAGAATKSVEETADDIVRLVVEECARHVEEWDWYEWISTGPHRDEGYVDFRGSMKKLASELRELAQKG